MQRRTNARLTPSSRNLVKISLSISLFATLGCDMIERGPVSYAPGYGPASSVSSAPSVSAAPSVPRAARQVDTGNQALIEAALEAMSDGQQIAAIIIMKQTAVDFRTTV